MLLRLFHLLLFLSMDVLLYLRLGRKIVKAGAWLAVVIVVWIIALIIYLPIFHIVPLARLKSFLILSGMIVQLLFVHYVGRFVMWRVECSPLSDDIKNSMNRIVSITTNMAIFGFYFLLYLLAFFIALQR